jgi:hypothetical protein
MSGVAHDKGISFVDDDGVRWTVAPISAGRVLGAAPAGMSFTSETGERRVAACPPGGAAWRTTESSQWRALLREALVVT